jgi:hypothetical protein
MQMWNLGGRLVVQCDAGSCSLLMWLLPAQIHCHWWLRYLVRFLILNWRNLSRAVWGSECFWSYVWLSKIFGHLICDICLKDYQFPFLGHARALCCLCSEDLYPSLWHIFCIQVWCLACTGKVCSVCYMKDEFYLLHSVNSEPVCPSWSQQQRGKIIHCAGLGLFSYCLWLPRCIDLKYCSYFWDALKDCLCEEFKFFQVLKESIRTENANNYTQPCYVWRRATESWSLVVGEL